MEVIINYHQIDVKPQQKSGEAQFALQFMESDRMGNTLKNCDQICFLFYLKSQYTRETVYVLT